ncbi:hypothetical protein EI171_00325 (plasmid) [Bradyrhizobium sp. LCT2]|uniref:hypothetical protein n=1 Tax=Bradyrhizobium sp. LCT2 TaxID=2493093 RepID=UPI00137452D3|nr:hypothetical protein [Bradyrhizobium sp. LCT2]QHP66045.1 hypothetical protein EI171_00325 [Bradyrhizobium sp. LCT2]
MSASYLYFLTIDVRTGMRPIFDAALAKLLEAHAKHPKGLSRFTTSYDNIAGAGDRAYLMVEMDALGDQDTWVHTPLIVIEIFGQEQGIQILDDWAGSQIRWESQILRRRVDDRRDAGEANVPAA